ncbi:MAG: hypothetical protein P0Y59_02785 [Candidatus Sphingomonas phytovorans]|nr:hypothetical protein [Sphingomonas sp.]WEK00637.1 MAG: hypothetical protein P0Y59_02785 [Sphingomonas sp.]
MNQIDPDTLGFIMRFELGKISNRTLKGMGSGHGDTRRQAVAIAADQLLKRMADWEILVPEPRGNFFADRVLPNSGPSEKGPT